MEWQTAIAAYAAGIATAGFGFAVWRSLEDRKPRVQVIIDAFGFDPDVKPWDALTFRVINHSSFPVTVHEAGFITADGTTGHSFPEFAVVTNIAPRESVHEYVPPDLVESSGLHEPSAAYVKLVTGEAFFSYVFRAWVERTPKFDHLSLTNQGRINRKVAKEWSGWN